VPGENELGETIRKRRRARNMTLARLAELAGVSTSYVSQVERGVANPTLSSLKTLTEALDLTVGSLLSEPEHSPIENGSNTEVNVLRAGNRRRVIYPGSHIANELLSPNLRVNMEVIWVEAPPGSGSGGHPHSHEGEECGIVISGAMRFWVGDEEWTLNERDSIYFPSPLPHRWMNPGDDALTAIWIITPPTF
jgi:transcriptional regulator with XRE-family HTH domain